VGPFLFALSALTGLLFVNAVAQRLEDLVGKGLPTSMILEFLVLSVPHTIALTLPMAVLVAVLYTFSTFTAANEFTAMAAGGIKPTRLLVPMLGMGTILAFGMLFFNDRVLPESNHRLAGLLLDLSQKSPTFQLRERVLNEISAENGRSKFFLQAARIDPSTNVLSDVVIYDRSAPSRFRTIYAERGVMAFNAQRTDLFLTLSDGVVLQSGEARPDEFRRMQFESQIIPLRGVADELEREMGREQRSDREMTIAMLIDAAREREIELVDIGQESHRRSVWAVERALGLTDAPPDSMGQEAQRALTIAEPGAEGYLPADPIVRNVSANLRTLASRERVVSLTANRFWVEVYKKFSISFTCIVFVLIGAPLAIRFPRGGVGMVIAASLIIFGIYWVGLIGGERMADRGTAGPFLAMWLPNLVFLVVGGFMVRGMAKQASTNRGGGLDEILFSIRQMVARLQRRHRRRQAA
jgi:lipopolysaccharide export system permease protein